MVLFNLYPRLCIHRRVFLLTFQKNIKGINQDVIFIFFSDYKTFSINFFLTLLAYQISHDERQQEKIK